MHSSGAENHLIDRLPSAARRRLLGHCELVHLTLEQVLSAPRVKTLHAYFPVDGFVSLVTRIDGHPGLEVGMVGREGMLGAELALGVSSSPLLALVQGAGSAWRIEQKAFCRELAASTALRRSLGCYIHVLMTQLAMSALCVRMHRVVPRLARWLLMSQDRAHADKFHATHEFLAYMLGVRRVGVTSAAVGLQREGLIDYRRGELQVLDRQGLEARACSCYAADQKAYADLLG